MLIYRLSDSGSQLWLNFSTTFHSSPSCWPNLRWVGSSAFARSVRGGQ